jgi:predicted TIM-barrel fold metal-dependent hydrolase
VAFATVVLQHADLAVEQLEYAIKRLGLRGLSISGSVGGKELANPKSHPVWAKAEELGILIFMHPLSAPQRPVSRRVLRLWSSPSGDYVDDDPKIALIALHTPGLRRTLSGLPSGAWRGNVSDKPSPTGLWLAPLR